MRGCDEAGRGPETESQFVKGEEPVIGESFGHSESWRPAGREVSPARYLIGQALVSGLASTLMSVVAQSLFLTRFGADGLAHIYIGLALFVPAVSFAYSAVYRRLSGAAIGFLVAVLFMGVCFGGWVLETQTSYRWWPYVLFLGSSAYVLLSGLVQGDQIHRLFNVREIKKVVPLIASGAIAGQIMGGLLVRSLIDLLGSSESLLLVIGSLLPFGLGFQFWTIRRFPLAQRAKAKSSENREKKRNSLRAMLKTRYVRFILLYGGCSGLLIKLSSYLYLGAAKEHSAGPAQLSSFLGLVYAVGAGTSLAFVLFGSSRVLNRFGVGAGLAGTPVVISPLIVAALGSLFMAGQPTSLYFWLVVAIFFLVYALHAGTTSAATRAALQALPVSERSLAEAAATGLGPSLAWGLAGVFILLLPSNAVDGNEIILILASATCLCWFLCSRLLHRDYGALLINTINRRALGSSNMAITERHTLNVLEQYLHGSNFRKVHLALEVLRESEHPSYQTHVLEMARSKKEAIKVLAIKHIEESRLEEGLSLLEEELDQPAASSAIQAASLQAYCSILEADAVDRASEVLSSPDSDMQVSALTGLLQYGGVSGVLAAGERLFSLQQSDESRQRMLLTGVIEKVREPSLYQLVLPLLQDEEMEVREKAFLVAGHVRHRRVVDALIEALPDRRIRSRAISSLSEMGDALIPSLKRALEGRVYPSADVISILRVIGKADRGAVENLLKQHLNHPDANIRTQVFRSLGTVHFRPNHEERAHIAEMIREEVGHGLRVLKAQRVMTDDLALAPLRRALGFEVSMRQDRIFLLLAFLHDAETVVRSRFRLIHGDRNEGAIALESLDLMLRGTREGVAYALIDPRESLENRIEKLDQVCCTPTLGRDACLLEIGFDTKTTWVREWTRSWAIYGAWHLDLVKDATALHAHLNDSSPLIREVAQRTIHALESGLQSRQRTGAQGSGTQAWFAPTLLGEEERMLLTIEKVAILQNVELFAETPDFALHAIATIAEERDLEGGETFLEEGVCGDGMYVIVEGEVRTHISGAAAEDLGPGDILDVIAIFDPGPRIASATTVEKTRMLWISKQAFEEAMVDRPEIAQASLRALARRLRKEAGQIDHWNESP